VDLCRSYGRHALHTAIEMTTFGGDFVFKVDDCVTLVSLLPQKLYIGIHAVTATIYLAADKHPSKCSSGV